MTNTVSGNKKLDDIYSDIREKCQIETVAWAAGYLVEDCGEDALAEQLISAHFVSSDLSLMKYAKNCDLNKMRKSAKFGKELKNVNGLD